MDKLKTAMAGDFKIVTNEYLILFLLALVGSAVVPFTFLWRPVLGIIYLGAMAVFLFRGLDKLLYLSVFDSSSSSFTGYLEDIGAALVSKCLTAAVGMAEILLLPVGAVALTVSMNALEWSEVLEWYAGFCSDGTAVVPILLAEAVNLAVSCVLTGALLMAASVCLIKIPGIGSKQSVREAVQGAGYLLCGLIGAAVYLWWLLAGLENSLAVCAASILAKLALLAASIPLLKRQVVRVYERL